MFVLIVSVYVHCDDVVDLNVATVSCSMRLRMCGMTHTCLTLWEWGWAKLRHTRYGPNMLDPGAIYDLFNPARDVPRHVCGSDPRLNCMCIDYYSVELRRGKFREWRE